MSRISPSRAKISRPSPVFSIISRSIVSFFFPFFHHPRVAPRHFPSFWPSLSLPVLESAFFFFFFFFRARQGRKDARPSVPPRYVGCCGHDPSRMSDLGRWRLIQREQQGSSSLAFSGHLPPGPLVRILSGQPHGCAVVPFFFFFLVFRRAHDAPKPGRSLSCLRLAKLAGL